MNTRMNALMNAFTTALLAILAVLVCALPAQARPVRFGVQIAPENASYEEIVTTFKLIEELGYDTAWLNDHFIPIMGDKDQSHFESWTLLAALASHTQRVRIGILVTGNTYRNPAILAKMATTVDHISHGRLNLGIGAGWEEFEHRAYGIPFYTPRERAERLGEALEVITKLFRGDHPSFKGKYYQLVEAPFMPRPVQQPYPPIVIGGQGEKWIMPLVARYADEWNVPIGVSPEGMKERLEAMREECRRLQRDPCAREVSAFLPLVNISNIPLAGPATRLGARLLAGERIAQSVLAGSADGIKSRIREYVEAGATSVIITTRPSLNHDLMRRFAKEIMPAFRE